LGILTPHLERRYLRTLAAIKMIPSKLSFVNIRSAGSTPTVNLYSTSTIGTPLMGTSSSSTPSTSTSSTTTTTTTILTPSTTSTTSTTSTDSTSSTSTTSTTTPTTSTTDTIVPRIIEFTNLDQPKELKVAKKALKGLVGVYAIINNITGAIYIGSSIDIRIRLVQHLVTNNTNDYLQNALKKYRLENFTFSVVEFCDPEVLLQKEQHYLDILFSLPDNLRYNFSPIAGAPIAGRTHTPETRAQMSDSHTGKTLSEETRAKMSSSQSGANHPMFGKISGNAMTVNVYSIDNVLVHSFPSQVAAAKWLNTSRRTVSRYIESGKVWNNQYRITKSTSSK